MTSPDGADPARREGLGRSEAKRRAILDAATEIFLRTGYLGASMDEVAARAAVSKQTVYKHFDSKEALFIAIASRMTNEGSDRVQADVGEPAGAADLADFLTAYATKQLAVVLTPGLMQLRRLVIAEAGRFPELGRALHDGGPRRAMQALERLFVRLAARGLLTLDDPAAAASHFNWLIMGEPVSQVMLLGNDAIPDAAWQARHAASGVRVFLAAYGAPTP